MTDAELDQWSEWSKRDDWHTLFVASDIRQMIGEIMRLRGALKPVALAAVDNDGYPDSWHIWGGLTFGDLRRARAAIAEPTGK